MKKILILGAGEAQLNLIRASKEFGYCVIVCDMRDGTEAEGLSDKYYRVDYMDREAVLEIARQEAIDGVISNSEPAMLSVAYVAETLGLPGNSVESVETLLSKSKFRDLQNRVGAYAPRHAVASTVEEAILEAKGMDFPIIVKPMQCSGTRGTMRIDVFDEGEIAESFDVCKGFSRNSLVEIEEYVEMGSLRINETEVFVLGDEFIWNDWMQGRSPDMPMLPMTYSYPSAMPDVVKKEIQEAVQRTLKGAGVRHGEFNVESFYKLDGKLFVIEINPRQGGYHIPRLIEQHAGISLTNLLVSTAVGDMSYYEFLKVYERQNNYVTLQVVFSQEDGILEHLYTNAAVSKYVKWIDQKVEFGECVVRGVNADDAVALVDMQFESYETQQRITRDIEKYIYPIVK